MRHNEESNLNNVFILIIVSNMQIKLIRQINIDYFLILDLSVTFGGNEIHVARRMLCWICFDAFAKRLSKDMGDLPFLIFKTTDNM